MKKKREVQIQDEDIDEEDNFIEPKEPKNPKKKKQSEFAEFKDPNEQYDSINISKNPFSDFYDTNTIKEEMETQQFNKKQNKVQVPWIEKYRPSKIDDIIGQDEVVKLLKKTLETGELPHLLFHGPPGSGKTSTIFAMARQLFGNTLFKERVVALNASDDRGIQVVRKTIQNISKQSIGNKDPNYLSPDYKIIILDEVDEMTSEAQSALRKMLETNSKTTRFCFICNYTDKILGPILSRCASFRFNPISEKVLCTRLKEVAKMENIKIDSKCIQKIVEISKGDARTAIKSLQNIKYYINDNKPLISKDIIELFGCVQDEYIDNIFNTCINGSFEDNVKSADNVIRKGFQIKYILEKLQEKTFSHNKLSSSAKASICYNISITDTRLTEGCSEYLQLLKTLLFINNICK
jgi:replication factor C subunit 2/4